MHPTFEKLAAAIIYADGELKTSELEHLGKLASDLGIETNGLTKAIEAEIAILDSKDEDEFQAYLEDAAAAVKDPETQHKIFDALLELSLIDNSLDDLETHVLGNISQYLQIPIHYFANNLAYQVKTRNVEITAQKSWQKIQEN